MEYFKITLLIVLVVNQGLGQSVNSPGAYLIRTRRSQVDSIFEDNMKVILTKLIHKGNINIGIPVLEPFIKDNFTFHINEADMIDANFETQGISNYTISKAKFDLVAEKINIEILFPKLYMKGIYNIDDNDTDKTEILIINGDFNATLTNFFFNIGIKLKIISNRPSIDNVDLKIALGSLDLSANGLPGDKSSSMILSKTISEKAPQFIDDHQTEIGAPIIKFIKERGKLLLTERLQVLRRLTSNY